MPRTCDTCNSPYVREIDKMVIAGWNIKEIERLLKSRYPGEKIPSYDSLLSHSNDHVKAVIQMGVESSTDRQRMIRQEIKASVLAARQLVDNLNIASSGLKIVWDEWLITKDFDRLKQVGTLIGTTNKSIELLLRYQKEISKDQMTEDEVFDRLMYCIEDFPTELVIKFKERWESFDPSKYS